MKAQPRRTVPMRIQRDAALDLCATLMKRLGMVPVDMDVKFELDHDPALKLRAVNPETGEHVPHQHDRRYLVWLTKEAHAEKTTGRRGVSDLSLRDGDQGKIAKVARLLTEGEEFRSRLLRKEAGEPALPSKGRLRGRGFPTPKPQRRATGFRRDA
jgi:hypothetical protein